MWTMLVFPVSSLDHGQGKFRGDGWEELEGMGGRS